MLAVSTISLITQRITNCNLNLVANAKVQNTFRLRVNDVSTSTTFKVIQKLNTTITNQFEFEDWFNVCKKFVHELNNLDDEKSNWTCFVESIGSQFGLQVWNEKSVLRFYLQRRYWDHETLSGGTDGRSFILLKH